MDRTVGAERFGETTLFQRATLASFLKDWRRRCAALEECVHVTREPLYRLSQMVVKGDRLPSLSLAVIDRTFAHFEGEHFFQAKSLSAELDAVGEAARFIAG